MDAEHPMIGDCANVPETLNGVDDSDGCPDEALARVDAETHEIVVLDVVYFDLDKASLQRRSDDVLGAVLQVLKAYPSIELVEVQGHTDSRGNDAYNLRLSQARVEAVRRWLIDHGIGPDRLVARGYGETQPLVPDATTEEEHGRNRRVAFKILRQSGGPEVRQ